MSLSLSRRTVLAGLAAGIVGAAIGLRLYWPGGSVTREARRLADILRHPDSAAWLGRLYLDEKPREADAALLVTLIGAARGPALPPASLAADEALRADLDERIRNDFIYGNTIAVDGWLLSLTEARLCALVSLLQDATPGKDA
ncbi:MAG: twin-arginine translocation signal domain-containing protein [Gammaproteobacteria bacterium]